MAGKRVLTLARELGAGDQGFAPPLAERLGLHVCDREMLEQQAIRLGVPEAELEKIDEQPAGIFQRFRPGSIYQRYFQALEQLTRELAERGEVLLVGRGGCWFLRDHPTAFHVRLTATLATRLRRVMEYRWVREDVAQKLIAQSDAQRRSFCENVLRCRLVRSAGVSPDGQQRPARAAGRGRGRPGRRASLEYVGLVIREVAQEVRM